MENARRITFFVISHILSAGQSNFILMILLINQWYLESQNSLVILAISKKKIDERFLIKKTSQTWCWVEKSKTNEWWENFINNEVPESDWKGNFRVSRKSLYELCSELHPYLLKKQNKKLNVIRSSSGVLY